MTKIVFVTATLPFGKGEEFFLCEFQELRSRVDVLIYPRRPGRRVIDREAALLVGSTVAPSWFRVMWAFLTCFCMRFGKLASLSVQLACQSGSVANCIKNFWVLPRGVYLYMHLRGERDIHIHACWASTAATIAYVAANLLGTPWSFSCHRGDIKQNNMLAVKAASAAFVRCISEDGRRWVLRLAGVGVTSRLHLIHMGVRVTNGEMAPPHERRNLVLAMPANLLPVKGHCYLIDAVAQLVKLDLPGFKVLLYGSGPLRAELAAAIRRHQLEGVVELAGHIDHRKLIGLYEGAHIDIVVLPSVTTTDGEHEGIPVSLMEAMAHGIPVVSTRSGAIAELVDDYSGVLVSERNAVELGDALASLLLDAHLRHSLGECGRLRIERQFNVLQAASAFLALVNDAT